MKTKTKTTHSSLNIFSALLWAVFSAVALFAGSAARANVVSAVQCAHLFKPVPSTQVARGDGIIVSPHSKKMILANLPEELKALAKTALLQKMGLDTDDKTNVNIGSFSNEAFDQLRVSGLIPAKELTAIVDGMLETSLAWYRNQIDLPQGMLTSSLRLPEKVLLAPPLEYDPTKPVSMVEKYDLASYEYIRRLQIKNRNQRIDFGLGLDRQYRMAKKIGDVAHAAEAIRYMLILGHYEPATEVAAGLGDNAALIQIGLLALNNYFVPGLSTHFWHNTLSRAIESLKRVEGPLRAKAVEILSDLATEISSPEHIQAVVAKEMAKVRNFEMTRVEIEQSVQSSALSDALRSLRSTGKVMGIWKRHNHLIYINQVESAETKARMRTLIHQIETMNRETGGFVDEMGLAKASISGGSPFTKDAAEALTTARTRSAANLNYLKTNRLPLEGEAPREVLAQIYSEHNLSKQLDRTSYEEDLAKAKSLVANGEGLNGITYVLLAAMKSPSRVITTK